MRLSMYSVKIVTTLIMALCASAEAGVLLQDSFDTLDSDKWTVNLKANSNAEVKTGQLHLTYNAGTWGSGSSFVSKNAVTSSDSTFVFTFQKISYTHWASETDLNAYHTYKLGLSSKAYLQYQHAAGKKESLRFVVDGTTVYDSSIWANGGIMDDNMYFGFRLTSTTWELIRSTDSGVTYSVWKNGTFATPISMNISDTVLLATGNAHAYGNDFVIDNVNVSAIPETASLGALGTGALALLMKRR